MAISTFGVTWADVASRWERGTPKVEDQARLTAWVEEGAGLVAAPIWELGVEPSEVTAEEPLHLYARSYIINHACALWIAYATRQDTEAAKACRADRDRAEALIKKYSVGNRGDEFDPKSNLGSFRAGNGRRGGGGGKGAGSWSRKSRM